MEGMRSVLAFDPLILGDIGVLQEMVGDVVELVARQNRYLMRRLGPRRIPPLYDSGVLYREDPDGWGLQHFPDCLTVLRRRFADCKGMVPYRLAQLREESPELNFSVRSYPRERKGLWTIHLQILLPTGDVEDPSRLLHQ